MKNFIDNQASYLWSRGLQRVVRAALACVLATVGAQALAQLVDISPIPLYGGKTPHPNIAVTMSVEFPTVGAAYLNVRYVRTSIYLGYFDPAQCYVYQGTAANGYFEPSRAADTTTHECNGGDSFSGNFMNWATMSAIDEFRYAMTGGNRVLDPANTSGAIVERAYLPDGSVSGVPSFYGYGSNFPRHAINNNGSNQLSTNGGGAYTASRAQDVLPSNLVGSNQTYYLTSCRNKFFIGTSGGGSCASPDNAIGNKVGEFQVRVSVCDASEGPSRKDLCLGYGTNGGAPYKPVGESQRNADKMRFAVFGYLMDRVVTGNTIPSGCNNGNWNECRYGGVLRAPMKYLGGTKYDGNLSASANPNAEVRGDGTLVSDPEGTAASAGGSFSGYLNYINKFGSGGVYKRYDPMGEMYYEAIRYFEGATTPTPEAVSGTINDAVKDYFPYATNWTDPIISRCSANYIINLSDANTWDDTYLPGYGGTPSAGKGRPTSRAVDAQGLDARLWTQRIGLLESTTNSITTNDVRPGLSNIANINTANNASYLAAGAAYWANTQDIRSDLPGIQNIKTISFDVGEASNTIQERQLYLMGKYGGFNNTTDRATDAFANPFWATNPSNSQGPAIRTNSEWETTTGSASPKNYLLASDPQKLITGLRNVFSTITKFPGTFSGAALTSTNLVYGAAASYTATFDPERWSGDVVKNAISLDGNGLPVVSPSPLWRAATVLDARCGTVAAASTVCTDTDTSANRRNIVTVTRPLGGSIRTAVDFKAINIVFDPKYTAALHTNPATGTKDYQGQARLNYLRGYRADEATTGLAFRTRASALGDILNSSPVYVDVPSSANSDASYQTFYQNQINRVPAVYAGANDGMLHAFRASDGVELFAYIPGYSYAQLNDLTDPAYTHKQYVDTVPTVQDAYVRGAWRTVLVGANGNGAQGMFALDVTDPTSFDPSDVLFEFSDDDDPDFGSVLSAPKIAKLRTGTNGTTGLPEYKYFAVVTGYNNKRTDYNGHAGADTKVSTNNQNQGVLFLISLDHVLGTSWTLGTDYFKYTFPAAVPTKANALGPVTLLPSRSGDLSTAAIYFGDLQGNLWRFNTTGTSQSSWVPARGTVASPLPIFVATDGTGVTRQPITSAPELASGPFGSTLVFFGTGQYLGETDLNLPGAQQTEYGLLDAGSSALITRSDLVARTPSLSNNNTKITVTGQPLNYSGPNGKKGWYLDFARSAIAGERSINKPAVREGFLTFTTLTLSDDICGGGSGFIYQLDAVTGLPYAGASYAGYASAVGIPGPPQIIDLTLVAGKVQPAGVKINTKTQATIVSGTSGATAASVVMTTGADGKESPTKIKGPPTERINWREITNWNDQTGH